MGTPTHSRCTGYARWLTAFGLLASAFAFAIDLRADAIDDLAAAHLKKHHVPGLTLAVVRNGEVIKAQGYGVANVEHQVPAKRETVYQSGSLGKQFTAAAIMLLVQDEKVSLDEPIAKYLPTTPKKYERVTVRHLLNHTGGIGDHFDRLDLRKDYTEDQLLAAAFATEPAFPAGEKFDYSNTGYVVLGILVSKLTGAHYGEFLQKRLFQPAGMTTARIIDEKAIIPNRSAGYELEGFGGLVGLLKPRRWRNQEWVSPSMNTTADGALYLTVDDLIRWDRAQDQPGPLTRESLTQMVTSGKTNDGKPTGYGFGISINKVNGRPCHSHDGAWQGFSTFMARFPEEKLTVIVLCNLANGDPGELAHAVARQVEPKLRADAKEPRSR